MPTLPKHQSHLILPTDISIYFLDKQDAPSYQQLRLESLRHHPQAFLSLYEAEAPLHQALFANHLSHAYHPPFFGFLGLFANKQLIGYLQLGESTFEKERHTASVYNLYISPKYRKQGLATLLFEYAFELLAQSHKIERIFLTCTASNKAAYRLYRQLGFQRYAVKKQAIKWQGMYDDEIEMVKVL